MCTVLSALFTRVDSSFNEYCTILELWYQTSFHYRVPQWGDNIYKAKSFYSPHCLICSDNPNIWACVYKTQNWQSITKVKPCEHYLRGHYLYYFIRLSPYFKFVNPDYRHKATLYFWVLYHKFEVSAKNKKLFSNNLYTVIYKKINYIIRNFKIERVNWESEKYLKQKQRQTRL